MAIHQRLLRGILVGAVLAVAAVVQAAGADVVQTANELRSQFVADLDELAAWCESNGLAEQAKKTRGVLSPTSPCKLYVPVLPVEVGPPKPSAGASAKEAEWSAKFAKLRHDQAAALFDLARRAVRSSKFGLAFDLAMASLLADPDFEPVRRLFGYQKFRNQWRTLYEVKKLRTGFVWSDRFGWLPKANLHRYEQGRRFSDGRWSSAEEDARRHATIQSGWDIETEHYTIRTDHSIEAGVALGVKLERLNGLWRQIFVRYYASQADVAALFEGRAKMSAAEHRHKIVYFRDRDDYNRTLQPTMPQAKMTLGVYVDHSRQAYFFPDKDGDRTLYHEATHQLFHESRPVASGVGRSANFWIVEGIAMFMETLRQEDGYYVLGGFEDERLLAARYRLLHDRFYVPFDEFMGYGIKRFQSDPRVGRLYSQSAGMAQFLVFADGGRYRDALVSYLVTVYNGHGNHDTLADLTGTSYGDLDKEYRAFIEREGK